MARVLVADVDVAVRERVAGIVRELGHKPLLVGDGATAVALVAESRADLVVTGHRLPRFTGLDLLRCSRQSGLSVPVIVIADDMSAQEVAIAFEHQAQSVLLKPFRNVLLAAAIAEAVHTAEGTEKDDPLDGLVREKPPLLDSEQLLPDEPGAQEATASAVDPDEAAPRAEELRALVRVLADSAALLPPAPPIMARLLEIYAQPEPDHEDLVALVTRSPALISRIVSLANSALYRAAKPVHSVDAALTRIGHKAALSIGLTLVHEHQHRPANARLSALFAKALSWNIGVAASVRALAQAAGVANPDDAYLAALFHDVGQPLLVTTAVQNAGGPINRADLSALLDECSTHHQRAGARLLESWHFPPMWVRVAAGHHGLPTEWPREDTPARIATLIATASQALARVGDIRSPWRTPNPDDDQLAAELIPLPTDDVDDTIRHVLAANPFAG